MSKPYIEMMLDGVQWKAIESQFGPASGLDDLPDVTHEGILRIGTLELMVYQLSNGERVIPEESMQKFLHWLGAGEVAK